MFCIKCGSVIVDGADRCDTCGYNLTTKPVISYDYMTVCCESRMVYEVIDSYSALGWESVEKDFSPITGSVSVTFKRERKTKNKEQLNRLKIKLDDCFNSIRVCEKNKTQAAMVIALIFGIVGTLIFGAGLSLFIAWDYPTLWMYISGGFLAAIGAIPCALAYFVFTKVRAKKTILMDAQIEKKRDEIDELVTSAQRFL